jgi:uncharacterized protein (DUF697 family)/predicted GTPase
MRPAEGMVRGIAIAEIDRALWQEGPVCLFAICRDRDLMPLVELLGRTVPTILADDPRYVLAPQRPSLWPDLIASGLDRLATIAMQGIGSHLSMHRGYTLHDATLELAVRLGVVVPEKAAVGAIEGALLAKIEALSDDLGSVLARPELASRRDLAEAVVLVAKLRAQKRITLGLDPRASPAALGTAVGEAERTKRQWFAQLAQSTFLTFDELLQKVPGGGRLDFARLQPCNILVCGKSGVGKSTLINAVFGRDVTKIGVGRPVTEKAAWFEAEGFPVRLMDTRGLEPGDYEASRRALDAAIQQARSSDDPEQQLHLVWHCIDEGSRRVENAETDLARMLARHKVPAICVLSKAWDDETNMEVLARERLPNPPVHSIVRVIASQKIFANGLVREPMGLENLVAETERLLPDAFKGAFAAAQTVALEPKVRQARLVIAAATASAAAAAATPVPFASAILLVPIQMGMVFGISRAVGLDLKQEAIKPIVGAALGTLATTFTGRAAAAALGELLKGIPGVGSIVGGAVDAAVAGALTKALGEGCLDFLTAHIHSHGQWPGTADLVSFFRNVWLKPKK